MKATFRGDVRAPANARSFVAGQLDTIADASGRPEADDIVLIVSELVTNAVRAGAEIIDVQVSANADRVEIAVSDDASGWPTARVAGEEDLAGRGLFIVEQLADTWTARRRGAGKTVTATWFRGPGRRKQLSHGVP